jgi:hypothetical protein
MDMRVRSFVSRQPGKHALGCVVICLVTVLGASCGPWTGYKPGPGDEGYGGVTPTPSPSPLPTDATAADLTFCVSETNRYRAMVGLTDLLESAPLEGYAKTAAASDGMSGTLHGYSMTHGIPYAENELLRWPLSQYGTVQAVIREGLSEMWAEGTDGEHFQNIIGPWTGVGCGVYISGSQITLTQDFK